MLSAFFPVHMYVPPSFSFASATVNVPSTTDVVADIALLCSLVHFIEYREDVFEVQENFAVPPIGM